MWIATIHCLFLRRSFKKPSNDKVTLPVMQPSSQTAWTTGERQTLTGNSRTSRSYTFNKWLRGSLRVLCSFAGGKVEAKRKSSGKTLKDGGKCWHQSRGEDSARLFEPDDYRVEKYEVPLLSLAWDGHWKGSFFKNFHQHDDEKGLNWMPQI